MPLDFWSLCLQLLGCWNYGHVPGDPMIPGGQTPSFMHSKQAICQLRQIPSPENDVALYTWVLHIMISYLINANLKKNHIKKCHPSKWASARRKTTQGWFWSTSVDGFLFLMWSGWDCVEETMNDGNLGQSDTLVEKRQKVCCQRGRDWLKRKQAGSVHILISLCSWLCIWYDQLPEFRP